MDANDAITTINASIAKMEVTSNLMRLEKNISEDAIEQYKICIHTLYKMGELAKCLIENVKKTQKILLRDNKQEE